MDNRIWLPPELLLYILSLSGIGPVRFSAVCAAWRNVALASRLLWTDIEVQDERPDVTLERARAFATRAGELSLNITRRATPPKEPYSDIKAPSLAVSRYIISIFLRCRTFSYLNILGTPSTWRYETEFDGSRHIKMFITTILSMRANSLETISFAVVKRRRFTIYISNFPHGLPHLATNFPALRSVHLFRLCVPLRQLGIPWDQLEQFSIEDICRWDTASHLALTCATRCYDLLLPTLTAIVRGTSLRVLSIKGEYPRYGFNKNKPDTICIEDILLPSLESLRLTKADIRWPTHEFRPEARPICLPYLTSLSIALGDDISRRPYSDNPTSATLLRLLQCMPNLVVLSIGKWTLVGPVEMMSKNLVVTLQHVRTLVLNCVSAYRLPDLYAGLDLPALEDLTLRDNLLEDSEYHTPISGSRWPLRRFTLRMDSVMAYWCGPLFADHPTMETIHLEGNESDDLPWARDWVLKIFSNPAMAPHAREVRCVMCQDVYADGVKRVIRKERVRPGLEIVFEACIMCIGYIRKKLMHYRVAPFILYCIVTYRTWAKI